MEKIRVRCANCKTIYDIYMSDYSTTDPLEPLGKCPKCGSNAFDRLKSDIKEYK